MDEVQAGSLVTLRYRLSCEGRELVSTMSGHPSTFQLGTGELAPPLEQCLLGMKPGSERGFDLSPDAFGAHNPDLVHRISRTDFPVDAKLAVGEAVTLAIAAGQQASGLIRDVDAENVLVDLNHPLAGRALRFEVALIGVL